MTTAERPKRRLRYFGTMSFALVALLVLAWALSLWLPHRREQAAMVAIQSIGGQVDIEPGGPDWLRKRVGDEKMKLFDRATRVLLNGCPVDERIIQHLSQLTALRTLELDDGKFGQAGLSFLAGLTELEELSLGHAEFNEADLVHLANLKKLRTLNLGHTQVGDSGLSHLSSLTNLQVLWLNDTNVTDFSLRNIENLKGLKRLSLRSNPINDAGLERLAKMTGLERLLLGPVPATPEGIAKLQTKLPACIIWYDPGPNSIAGSK